MTKQNKKKDTAQRPASPYSPIWGGRFSGQPSELMATINASIDFDQKLFEQDIRCSKAHASMLAECGIISQKDKQDILTGLNRIYEEIKTGTFVFKRDLEDIHMNIEARLTEIIGEPAGKLHTARSRNDQVATGFKLWLREHMDHIDLLLKQLISTLIDLADKHAGDIMPGFTHLQPAQPVTIGHHLLAYGEMFGRDRGRLVDCRRRLNECPLGTAALAGTSFPINREKTAKELGFDRPVANSLDAVADRDFAMEFLAAAALSAVHLSRLSEELIIWSTPAFDFVRLSDSFSTGSSIMPQKRNPDAVELIKGKTGRIIGALNTLLSTMKGLPLAYARDMQEDKEPVFDAVHTLCLGLAVMTGVLQEITFNTDKMEQAAGYGFSTATDLADWLVRVLDIPFRRSHHITGQLVKMAESKGCQLENLPLAEMQKIEPGINQGIFDVLGVHKSVASRTSFGGTAPANVKKQVLQARKRWLF